MTDVERKLWYKLRDRRLGGHKIAPQLPVGPFIADFACRDARLLIELDGTQHAGNVRDERRDHILVGEGYRVLRFWNADVAGNIEAVCETILAAIEGRLKVYDRFEEPR